MPSASLLPLGAAPDPGPVRCLEGDFCDLRHHAWPVCEPAAGGGQFAPWHHAQAMTASHRLPRFRGVNFHLYWVRLLLVQVLCCEFWKLPSSLELIGRIWGSPGARGEAAGPDSGRAETRAAPDIHSPSSMIFNVQPSSVCLGPRF